MSISYPLRLGGFVRPIPGLSTFVHPVFLDHKGTPVLQLSENDIIRSWKQYRPDETLEFVNSNVTAKPGDPSVYGFVFTDDTLVFGERSRLAKALASDSRVSNLALRQPHTYARIIQFIDESSPRFFSLNGSECLEHTTALSSNPIAPMLLGLLKGIGKHLEDFVCFYAPLSPVAQAASGLQSATLQIDDNDELELRWGHGTLTAIPRRSRPMPIHLSALSNSLGLADAPSIIHLNIVEHEVSTPFEPTGSFLFVLNRAPSEQKTDENRIPSHR